jgi:hypothetical protein
MIDIAGMVTQSTASAEAVAGVSDDMRQSSERVRAEIPAIVQEATRRAEQRETDRFSSSATVPVEVDGRSLEVDLIDLSQEGARIGPVDGVVTGTRLALRIEGRRREADVVWCNDTTVGVRFLTPLDPATVHRLAETQISAGRRDLAA